MYELRYFFTGTRFTNNRLTWLVIAVIIIIYGIVFIFLKNKDRKRKSFEDILSAFGFAYDKEKDIFYSLKNAWQRNFGYCELYDEATALFGMILDCEPICFEYDGKSWLIEFWKGQYNVLTGCEVGVYTTQSGITTPGKFRSIFYGDINDYLEISVTLLRDNKVLFSRSDTTWWLTGFKLGIYSDPRQLKANIHIRFKNVEMQEIFVSALKNIGYTNSEFRASGTSVFVYYDVPHTVQPITRTAQIEEIVQFKNKLLCDAVNAAVQFGENGLDQIISLKNTDAKLYKKVVNSLSNKKRYKGFRKIQSADRKINNILTK